jgi:predicted metalloprotease
MAAADLWRWRSLGGRSIGIGTIVVALVGGIKPADPAEHVQRWGAPTAGAATCAALACRRSGRLVSTAVLADTEDVWKDVFAGGGTQEPCAVSPRKPLSVRGRRPWGLLPSRRQKVYIDLGFY